MQETLRDPPRAAGPRVEVLPNGLRVAVERVHHARSVAVGVWLGAGSLYERPGEAGAAHFLEHMLFKGTIRRSGRALADLMDATGGEFNAVTGRETTCYYGWVLADQWPRAVSILAELLLESRIDAAAVEQERLVILEEIRGEEEAPESRALMDLDRLLWGRHPYGRPIAGTVRSASRLTREQLLRLKEELYTPDNAVVSLAGNVDPDAAVEAVRAAFGGWTGRRARRPGRPPRPVGGVGVRRRRLDQAHLVFGSPGPGLGTRELYPALVLSTLLGGGQSSRLFQRIREDEALAYTVYSFHEAYRGSGAAGVYAAVRPDGAVRAASLIRAEFERLAQGPIDPGELERARMQLKSSVVFGLESMVERMNRMGEQLLLLGRVTDPEELIARIDAVTAEDVQAAARAIWGAGPLVTAAVGPVSRPDIAGV
ncbi:M16 family metallopeptidase [Caldinitratiruptor microaerophilus]|uniref:Peptidase M16 n=1 Tax=Caldinitratiruptor microaerophilus TaxID=671077 RepID=A0AA35CNF5_9FIRM|nr:pitrilysin family protein [Caldinitratiruptor microaerophilus]BDG61628.1 peptidase M16 [Caldinitratiruptor microaerophilus]